MVLYIHMYTNVRKEQFGELAYPHTHGEHINRRRHRRAGYTHTHTRIMTYKETWRTSIERTH